MINQFPSKWIFIHIPRTGGTSLEYQLNNNSQINELTKHQSLHQVKLHLDISEYFKFSFIRNPWDIVISKYLAPYYRKINSCTGKNLLYFLENYYPASNEAGDSFFDYFDPSEMDFIGRFETREKDLNYISKMIGLEIDPSFSVKKKEMQRKLKSKKHFTSYYDEQTLQIVYEKYKKDIEYFQYSFPLIS